MDLTPLKCEELKGLQAHQNREILKKSMFPIVLLTASVACLLLFGPSSITFFISSVIISISSMYHCAASYSYMRNAYYLSSQSILKNYLDKSTKK